MRLKVELSKLIGRFCASWRKSNHFVFVAIIVASKQVYYFFKDTNHRQFLSFVALLVQTHRYFHLKWTGAYVWVQINKYGRILLWPTHRLCPWIINYTPPCTTVF